VRNGISAAITNPLIFFSESSVKREEPLDLLHEENRTFRKSSCCRSKGKCEVENHMMFIFNVYLLICNLFFNDAPQ
jgi:hypothetical protein